jgi:hypothetical protein
MTFYGVIYHLVEHLFLGTIPGFDVHAYDEHFVDGKNDLRNGLQVHGTEALLSDSRSRMDRIMATELALISA